MCLECDANNHFILLDDACVCEYGYYLEDNQCLKCGVGCNLCVNADQCN
jgi:hypothetical protein